MLPTEDASDLGCRVSGRGRDDACPGALRLHTADDGALARVRLPGGVLTARQALGLAEVASELGDGRLETTSRGNVQLRGLPADAGRELGARLDALGLLPSEAHERVRNIVASPLSGLDGLGRADVRPLVDELDAGLCADADLAALSGRFLFALDDGRGDVASLKPDVTLIALAADVTLIALGEHAVRVPTEQAVPRALLAGREFLRLTAERGIRAWRVREVDPTGEALIARLPGERVAAPVLPRTLPTVGPAGGSAFCVGLPFGRATADQWRLLARTATELRVTPWRSVVLPGVTSGAAFAEAGLRTDPASPWELATACTGTPGCAKSLADVRADAAAALDRDPGDAALLPVHWSGCERRCGHPAGAWVDALATPEGYRVAVNPAAPDAPTEVTTQHMAAAVAAARRTK